jgi:low affinity Fe/Cu permease
VQIAGLAMVFSIVVMVLMVLAVTAMLPIWPWSRSWGYGNATALALITCVVLINAALTRYVV